MFIILDIQQKKPQWNVFSVNPLYLIINKIKGHFEEVDGDKYLIINSENSDIMQKYQEVFNGIKNNNQPTKYDDNYMKIKFNTDDNIPVNEITYFPTITIIIRSVTKKDDKYYDMINNRLDCLYEV